MVIESGSIWSAVDTLKPPTGIQLKRCWTNGRLPGDRPSSPTNTMAVKTNDPPAISVASQPGQRVAEAAAAEDQQRRSRRAGRRGMT